MSVRKPKPASVTDAFYASPSPARAIELAIADHKAFCAPGQPMHEFVHQLNIALDIVRHHDVHRCQCQKVRT